MDSSQRWSVSEVGFTSEKPVVGPLLVRFRTLWNQISTRWYVLPIIQQVNVILEQIYRRIRDISEWLAAMDREQTRLRRSLAEAQLRIAHLERRLGALERQSIASSAAEEER
jgi:hypothetical protein